MSRLSLGHSWVKEQKRWQVTWALKSSGQRRQRRRRQKEQLLSLLHSAAPPIPWKFSTSFWRLGFWGCCHFFICKEAKKGAGAPLPHPYKFSFGPVLEVVLSGSCIFANGWLAKGLSGALASGAFWVWRQMGGEKTAFWQTHCLQAVISLATLIIIETAQSSSLLNQKR